MVDIKSLVRIGKSSFKNWAAKSCCKKH